MGLILNSGYVLSQKIMITGIDSIICNKKLIYKDTNILTKHLTIRYCDSTGNISNKVSAFYAIDYKGYHFIYNSTYDSKLNHLFIEMRSVKRHKKVLSVKYNSLSNLMQVDIIYYCHANTGLIRKNGANKIMCYICGNVPSYR